MLILLIILLTVGLIEKNINKALELLEKAVQIEPTDAYIIDSLGGLIFLLIR